MKEKFYESDDDYILEILEGAEDKLIEDISDSLSEPIKIKFSKLLAVIKAIENINIQHAFENEYEKYLNLKIMCNKVENNI